MRCRTEKNKKPWDLDQLTEYSIMTQSETNAGKAQGKSFYFEVVSSCNKRLLLA